MEKSWVLEVLELCDVSIFLLLFRKNRKKIISTRSSGNSWRPLWTASNGGRDQVRFVQWKQPIETIGIEVVVSSGFYVIGV